MPNDSLPVSVQLRLEEVCARFEAAWQAAASVETGPRIEEHLGAVAGPERTALLRELLRLDVHYRRRHGKKPGANYYAHHHPADAEAIRTLFNELFPVPLPPRPATPVAESSRDTMRPGPAAETATDPARTSAPDTPAKPEAAPAKYPAILNHEILGELGRGAMGVVYQARQTALKRLVALKMIVSGDRASAQELARFRREAESVARLQHPNIVQIYEVGEYDGRPFFSLEFVDGGTLATRLRNSLPDSKAAAELVEKLARAMHAVHQCSVVHRDLKPANVLLAGSPEAPLGQCTPKISDFGLAKKLDEDAGQTHSGAIMGSPSYMAPEQASGGAARATPLADVYALGAILYECLTGRAPFRAATVAQTLRQVIEEEPVRPRTLNAAVPRDVETVCLKCLHKDPTKRYLSAESLAEDLRRWLDGEPIEARPIGHLERTGMWIRRHPAQAVVGVLALLLLGLAGAGAVLEAARRNERVARERAEREGERIQVEQDLARKEEEAREEQARPLRYLADVRQAFQAAQEDDFARVRLLLNRYQPKVGAADLRRWEWFHLRALCREPSLSFRGHQGSISALVWSPDGKRLASGSADGMVRVWDVAAEKEAVHLVWRHRTGINVLAWSPDGKRLASVASDGTLRVRDPTTGKEIFSLGEEGRRHRNYTFAAWSPDGKRLLLLDGSETLRVCEAATGKESVTINAHAGGVLVAAWSPDGGRLASAGPAQRIARWTPEGPAHEVKIWDARSGKEVLALAGHTGWVGGLAWSPDGKRLATAGADRTIRLWDASTGKETKRLGADALQFDSGRLAWDGNPQRLSLTTPRSVTVWDPATGKVTKTLHLSGLLSPDGRRFLIPSGSDWVISDADTGQRLTALRPFINREMGDLPAWSPDGRRIAAGGRNGTVRIWTAAPKAVRLFPAGTATWSPDSRRIVLLDREMAIASWDVFTQKQTVHLPGLNSGLLFAAWRPDGRRVATAHADGRIKLWEMEADKEPLVLALPGAGPMAGARRAIHALLWSANGKRLAVVAEGALRVWDAATGQALFTAAGEIMAPPRTVAWSPDGKRLAINAFGPIRVHDVESGKPPLDLQLSPKGKPPQVVGALAWDPDGKRLAALGSRAAVVKVWEADTGKEVCSVEQPPRGGLDVHAIAWSPDGKRLAVTQMGQGFKVLEVATKKELLAVGGGTRLDVLAWSPDGKQLATLDHARNEVVKVWDVETGKEAFTLSPKPAPPGAPFFSGRSALSWSPDGRQIAFWDTAWEVASRKVIPFPDGPRERVLGERVLTEVLFWDATGPHFATVKAKGRMSSGTWVAMSGKQSRIVSQFWWGMGNFALQPAGAAWSRDARRMALPRGDGFELWDVMAGRMILALSAQRGPFRALSWDPAQRRIAAVRLDGFLRVWDVSSGQALLTIAGRRKDEGVNPLSPAPAWSPEGKRLASAGAKGSAVVWEAATGKQLLALGGHHGNVSALAWSPDGKRLASGDDDATVKLWDAASGKEVAALRGDGGAVYSLAWSPDGRRLASVGRDGGDVSPSSLKLWDVASG
jgi:WD40 repeat protein